MERNGLLLMSTRDDAWHEASEWLMENDKRCEIDCQHILCEQLNESLAKFLRGYRKENLEEAAVACDQLGYVSSAELIRKVANG